MKVKYWILGSLAGLTVLVAAFFGTYLYLQPNTEASQSVSTTETVEKQEEPKITVQGLLEATNAEREKRGIKPLILDERLNASAQKKLKQLQETGDFSHYDKNGISGVYYIPEHMNECVDGSENLNKKNPWVVAGPKDIIDSLMSSESHKRAILNDKYQYIGFAYDDMFAVQHFCSID